MALFAATPTHRPTLLAWCLTVLFMGWNPVWFAVSVSSILSRLAVFEPLSLGILILRTLSIGLGMVAGRALVGDANETRALVLAAAASQAVTGVLVRFAPAFPTLGAPSERRRGLLLAMGIDLIVVLVAWRGRLSRVHEATRELTT